MTAHWIGRHENALQFKSSLIAFHRVWGKHTGKNLAKIVFDMLERVGVTSKVFLNSKFEYFINLASPDWILHTRQRCK
jgi:hypothetical protein